MYHLQLLLVTTFTKKLAYKVTRVHLQKFVWQGLSRLEHLAPKFKSFCFYLFTVVAVALNYWGKHKRKLAIRGIN